MKLSAIIRAIVRHMPDCLRPITGDGRIEFGWGNKYIDAQFSVNWGTVREWQRPWIGHDFSIRRMTPELYRRRTGTWPLPRRHRAEERPS